MLRYRPPRFSYGFADRGGSKAVLQMEIGVLYVARSSRLLCMSRRLFVYCQLCHARTAAFSHTSAKSKHATFSAMTETSS